MIENLENDSLLVSESSLAYIPKNKFNSDSWSILDRFMDYATDVFTITVQSLIKNGYLRIEKKEVKTFKIFGIVVWTGLAIQFDLSRIHQKKIWSDGLKKKYLNNLNMVTLITLMKLFMEFLI